MGSIEDKYFVALANHLNSFIEAKNLKVADLAAAADLDRKQIYRLLKKENIPTLTTLIRIALAAGIHPKDMHDFKFNFASYMKEKNIIQIKPGENE